MKRWVNRPEGSNWGDFGENDELGRLNLITPARRRAALEEAREGLSFVLSLPLDVPGGNGLVDPRIRAEPQLFAGLFYNRTLADLLGEIGGPGISLAPGCVDLGCDDGVTMHLQYSTQWDGLSHVGALFDADGDGVAEPVYYNGWRANTDVISPDKGGPYSRALGIEQMAATGVQGRGVLVDLVREFGFERRSVGYNELMRAAEWQKVEVATGDILCIRTGFSEVLLDMNKQIDRERMKLTGAVIDGSDPALQRWITECGVAAICADNPAVEADLSDHATPLEKGYTLLPLHHLCLFKLGIHLGEYWYFRELADWLDLNGRSRFLLTAPGLRLPGAVGSPVTPVATV